ncbi:iron-sulfur cluster assembly protein SufD [Lachnospiraceae bacterium KM106-2]|nr:iron-sulfur cluster assembly protein SufD [Lachnospiraceae bacterium KM106-2]
MRKNASIVMNHLPVSTWNHLGVNNAEATLLPKIDRSCNIQWEFGDESEIILSKNVNLLLKLRTGMGEDMDRMLRESPVLTDMISVEKNHIAKEPVRIQLLYQENSSYGNHFTIHAAPNSEITVIMDYSSKEEIKALALTQVHMLAEQNSKIRLIQVQRLGQKMIQFNDLGGLCEDNALIEIIQADFGAGKMYSGCFTELLGRNSKVSVDIGYQEKQSQSYDMNYVVNHYGKKSESSIKVNGILEDHAFKLFRGTIDFKKGAKGANGEEAEEVLLIGNDMINKTVPLILCEEEEVQGNHGATIGKLSEEVMFYLQSRGLKTEEVYTMIANAKIDLLCQKIQDERTAKLLAKYKKGGN